MDLLFAALLSFAGGFSLILGILHFFFPLLFDFDNAIPADGPPLKPFPLWFRRGGYATQRSDVRGIAWVMNHATSYVLVTVGLLDLFWAQWLGLPGGRLLALWIAGWWFVRAASQLYLGRRRGDWLILAWFAALGLLHLWAAARLPLAAP